MEWMADPQAWMALATLTALEIVLGIDNIIFISILVGRLPNQQRNRARFIGLALALLTRIGLLLTITLIMRLTAPLFQVSAFEISGRDIILLGGGLFLIAKSTLEIHNALEVLESEKQGVSVGMASFAGTLVHIIFIEIVFSLDSVITAVGMVQQVPIMILAIIIAVIVMMVAARSIGQFVDSHPTVKMLALSFLVLIGVALIGEGLDMHIPKGYIYFAKAFSCLVELLNMRIRKPATPVELHKQISEHQ